MIVRINGNDEAARNGSTISSLILGKAVVPDRVVVEHNGRIIPKKDWQDTMVNENDTIEIISFMGGG